MTDFNTFWQTYPSDLTQNKKGPKSVAQKSWDKIPADKHEHIITCLRELIRYGRQEIKTHQKTDRWPFASTWLNQCRWETIEDITPSKLKEEYAGKSCACGKPVDIKSKCWDCYYLTNDEYQKNRKDLYGNLCKIGMGKKPDESKKDYAIRCREYLLSHGGLGRAIAARARIPA